MSILQELEAAKKAKEAADKRVEELLKKAKDEGLAEIRRIVEDLGLTAKDLLKLVPSEPQKTRRVRKPAAFWYQHPTDPNLVWKGAGPKPAWFKELSEEAQQACKIAAG
jgi:DNA-binding protein H-NS